MSPSAHTLLVLNLWFLTGCAVLVWFTSTHRGRNPWSAAPPGEVAVEAVFFIWAWPLLLVTRFLDG